MTCGGLGWRRRLCRLSHGHTLHDYRHLHGKRAHQRAQQALSGALGIIQSSLSLPAWTSIRSWRPLLPYAYSPPISARFLRHNRSAHCTDALTICSVTSIKRLLLFWRRRGRNARLLGYISKALSKYDGRHGGCYFAGRQSQKTCPGLTYMKDA